ncbi:hypothetical protein RIF29_26236 [Crotalaria pallida]|uniref:Uncharacterized protein n=1 Tax=Crotalaria pallida TaxID=3830 RepID=A0AAN9END6_CROPI
MAFSDTKNKRHNNDLAEGYVARLLPTGQSSPTIRHRRRQPLATRSREPEANQKSPGVANQQPTTSPSSIHQERRQPATTTVANQGPPPRFVRLFPLHCCFSASPSFL